MITLGITGTIGAGKGTVVEYLMTKGFKHYSVRNVLLEEIKRRGIEPTREAMQLVANDFRKNSPSYIMERLLEEAKKNFQNEITSKIIIESIRATGEIEFLRKNAENFSLLAVDADARVRYDRIYARKSSTDNITFEHFLEYEKTEFENKEPWKMNLLACIKQADFVCKNNGTLQELHSQIDHILGHILGNKKA